jgi:hyperosmotically inducible periplasmic protein
MNRFLTALALAIPLCACSAQQQNAASENAQQLASSAPDAAKNAYLTAAVATKLATVDVNSTTSVQVSADGGVVTRKGEAVSAASREAYVNAAKSIDGVSSVRDMLAINPKLKGLRQQAGDATLQARVAAAIAAQAGVNVLHVTSSVHEGTVTLTGGVPTRAIASTIDDAARGVSGVRAVVDHLSIGKT